MLSRVVAALACSLTLGLSAAEAHFIWIDFAPAADGQPQARLYFSEMPEPGEPHLVAKIGHTQAWSRDAAGQSAELKVGKAAGETAALPLAGAVPPAGSLEATCDYGVYQRGPAGLLLQYYAKRLTGDWAKNADTLGRSPRLALDIVPRLEGGKLTLEVLYKGEPACNSEVVVVGPNQEPHEYKTDDKGRATADITAPGRYAVRAAHIEADRQGQRDGKNYAQTWHYCTLVADVDSAAFAAEKPVAADNATEALRRARDGRAVWDAFPGFTAKLSVTSGDQEFTCQAKIDSSGTVELDAPPSKLTDWVEEQLNSLVQHRMPSGEIGEGNVTYVDEPVVHPLGRKINLGDANFQSAYRIKDDVIMEVNRSAGPQQRFTISVLEIVRNAENKYLPRAFTMNFFDAQSGALKLSLGYWNEWQRVGKFDLPKTILEVGALPGGTATRQIVFSDWKLAE
ncbi:MAG: DUF3386 family protein [Pirellulales bacterium]